MGLRVEENFKNTLRRGSLTSLPHCYARARSSVRAPAPRTSGMCGCLASPHVSPPLTDRPHTRPHRPHVEVLEVRGFKIFHDARMKFVANASSGTGGFGIRECRDRRVRVAGSSYAPSLSPCDKNFVTEGGWCIRYLPLLSYTPPGGEGVVYTPHKKSYNSNTYSPPGGGWCLSTKQITLSNFRYTSP